jgi:phosphatidylserine decarboxylase
MYHRFHAPYDGRIEQVTYIAGDTWNVNPIALKRIERLFCKNERAAVKMKLAPGGQTVALVAVAAILVASIRMHCLPELLNGSYRGRNVIACDSDVRKGDELGWFQHGSTIIVFAPEGFALCDAVHDGAAIRMGQPLMRLP